MKCRKLKREGSTNHVVWFGSCGKNEDGTAKFVTPIKYDNDGKRVKLSYNESVNINYSGENEGVEYSLTQRLSVIKGELWYNINAGIPLLEKQRNKGILDSYIISTVLNHPDVITIDEFESYIENNHTYKCSLKCSTNYGEVEIEK